MTWDEEYSEKFDVLRKNRVKTSYYKYGPAKVNYTAKLVDAVATAEVCIEKYRQTGNTEYLCDAANYLMFEFMYPQRKDAFFRATEESAGQVGLAVNQLNS